MTHVVVLETESEMRRKNLRLVKELTTLDDIPIPAQYLIGLTDSSKTLMSCELVSISFVVLLRMFLLLINKNKLRRR